MTESQDFPFRFNPDACQECRGECCRWGGFVWVTEEEIQAISELMKMDLEAFVNTYVKASYRRLSLQERLRDGEYHCCLFDPFNNRCLVYQARPEQCRTFPFWDVYKKNTRLLLEICPGVELKA